MNTLKILHCGKGAPLHPFLKEQGVRNFFWDGCSEDIKKEWKSSDLIFLRIRDYCQKPKELEKFISRCSDLISKFGNKIPAVIALGENFNADELRALRESKFFGYFDFSPEDTFEERYLFLAGNVERSRRTQKEFKRIKAQSTTLKNDNKDLRRLTLVDDLTGLNNTRYMKEMFDGLFQLVHRYDRPLSVFILDLDHFKDVNDKGDHLIGSTVLKEMGRLLIDQTRKSDIRIRYGGDEFVVIMPETDATSAMQVAERVKNAIAKLNMTVHHNFVVKVTASLGVATFDRNRHSVYWELLREADVAMYEAKKRGRNRVSFFEGEVRGYDTNKSSFSSVLKNILDPSQSGVTSQDVPEELNKYLEMIKKGEL